MHLDDIQIAAWRTAEHKGHHAQLAPLPVREQTLIRLALIHTEVSEATQHVKRQGITPATLPLIAGELADTLIRLCDLAQCLQIDLMRATILELDANTRRPHGYGTPWEVSGEGSTTRSVVPTGKDT
jgi:NTP pyrophosphatase (non-canonical NTP hydrolase)